MRVSPSRSVFGHPAQGQRDTLSARQAPARNAWPSWGLEMGPDVLCDQLLRFLRLEESREPGVNDMESKLRAWAWIPVYRVSLKSPILNFQTRLSSWLVIKAGTLKLHELVYRVSPKFPILICRLSSWFLALFPDVYDYRIDVGVTLVSDITTLYTWCLINFVSQCFTGVRIYRRILLTWLEKLWLDFDYCKNVVWYCMLWAWHVYIYRVSHRSCMD